jgi:hypothetical protein
LLSLSQGEIKRDLSRDLLINESVKERKPMETVPVPAYPATLSIDYPDRPLDRLTSAFRIITVIPIMIVLGALTGSGQGSGYNYTAHGTVKTTTNSIAVTAGILFFSTMLMIVFRQKYPRWWYDWNLQFTRFGTRVGSYFALLRDEYPSTDEEQAVHIDFPYPDVKKDLNRWLPLVKWFLAFPHYIVLVCLFVAAVFCTIFAWFAILFTGRYPKGLFDFVVGVQRWALRVSAYAAILVTDKYPPFNLD